MFKKGVWHQLLRSQFEVAKGLSNKGGLILKAQVHAGGRGKGHLTSGLKGGVQICKDSTRS